MIVVTRSDEYLKHHGILGMKWGKKNGPPYPNGESNENNGMHVRCRKHSRCNCKTNC